MAETTLIVSGGKRTDPPVMRSFHRPIARFRRGGTCRTWQAGARLLVSCGRVIPDGEIVIVDPETRRELPPDGIGEIWIRSSSVGQGYLNKPEITAETFRRSPGGLRSRAVPSHRRLRLSVRRGVVCHRPPQGHDHCPGCEPLSAGILKPPSRKPADACVPRPRRCSPSITPGGSGWSSSAKSFAARTKVGTTSSRRFAADVTADHELPPTPCSSSATARFRKHPAAKSSGMRAATGFFRMNFMSSRSGAPGKKRSSPSASPPYARHKAIEAAPIANGNGQQYDGVNPRVAKIVIEQVRLVAKSARKN